jgi:hypothetical protein
MLTYADVGFIVCYLEIPDNTESEIWGLAILHILYFTYNIYYTYYTYDIYYIERYLLNPK